MISRNILPVATALLGLSVFLQPTARAEPVPVATAALPDWITELTVSAKESYDDNVFGSKEVLQAGYPDLVEKSAWVTSVGARFFFSPAAMAGAERKLLVVGYSPTLNTFSRFSTENNSQHRLTVQSSGKSEAWSWSLDNTTTYIDGSRESLRYTGYSSFGIALPRERRSQWQDAGKFSLKYGFDNCFVRAAGSLTYYDLLTEHHVATGAYAGWLNFADRYDTNAGLDFGWNMVKGTALILGWRSGYQYQQSFPWTAAMSYTSSNHYNRALAGVEGNPAKWLSLSLNMGPDFRHYDAPEATRGVVNATQTAFYIEANATAKLNKTDSLILTGKQWRWVPSTGRAAYDDKNWQLAWKHGLSAQFSVQLSGQFQQSQYVTFPTAISTTGRNDLLFTGGAQIQWTPSKRVAVTLEYIHQRSENAVETGAIAGREFGRNVTAVGLKYTF